MVRHCQMCKKLDISSPDVSFHKVPADSERRKIWASLLGWKENRLTKYLYVCSDHFDSSDIITMKSGSKYLRPDASPLPCHSAFQFASDSSDSTVFNTPKRLTRTQGISYDVIASPVNVSPSSNRQLQPPTESGIPSSSSGTATASEPKDEILKFSSNEENAPNLGKKRKRCYVSDMASSDFLTPEKRRRNLKSPKNTVGYRRRKIHNTQNSVRRLRPRMTSLKSYREESTISRSNASSNAQKNNDENRSKIEENDCAKTIGVKKIKLKNGPKKASDEYAKTKEKTKTKVKNSSMKVSDEIEYSKTSETSKRKVKNSSMKIYDEIECSDTREINKTKVKNSSMKISDEIECSKTREKNKCSDKENELKNDRTEITELDPQDNSEPSPIAYDPLDLNAFLVSTSKTFQQMCDELRVSTILNNNINYVNASKERITLTTPAEEGEQSLEIFIVNKAPDDTSPSFIETATKLEDMVKEMTNMLSTSESREPENHHKSTQTMISSEAMRNIFSRLEGENVKLKVQVASLEIKLEQLQRELLKEREGRTLVS